MKVTERVGQLRVRIGEIREAEKHALDAGALELRRGELESYRRTLQTAIRTARVLVNNGRLEPDTLPSIGKLEESLTKVMEGFTGDPNSITKGRSYAALQRCLGQVSEELANLTNEAWKQEVSTAPKSSEALLNKIASIRGRADLVKQLRAASSDLAEISKSAPTDQSEWLRYQSLRQLVEERVNALSSTRFPKAAIDFCIAAQQSKGAPLSMLTDEVRVWLQDQGMLEDLRYRFT